MKKIGFKFRVFMKPIVDLLLIVCDKIIYVFALVLEYCIGKPLALIFEYGIRKPLAFIFWTNKYAVRRREYEPKKRKLRLKAFKEIVISTMVPLLKKLGYSEVPNDWFGWSPNLQAYDFNLAKIQGNQIRKFEILLYPGTKYIVIHTKVGFIDPEKLDTIPDIWNSIEELVYFEGENRRIYPEQTYALKIKNFNNDEQLKNKSIPLLKQKIEREFSDLEQFNKKFFGKKYDWDSAPVPDPIQLQRLQKIREENMRLSEEENRKHKDRKDKRQRKKREASQ